MIHDFNVGESVYIHSISLNEIIPGIVEGFTDSSRKRIKVLQQLPEGYLRHIVSYAYLFRNYEDAEASKKLAQIYSQDINWSLGMVVLLRQNGKLVTDNYGSPYLYQIVKVNNNKSEVSLVTYYGESIGSYNFSEIQYYSDEPLFSSKYHEVGDTVSWIDKDDIYEGIITKLHESSAEVSNIKKLFPLDFKKKVPYYKLSGPCEENTSNVIASIIGDTLDD